MRWPQQIQAGQTISQPVSALDFLPTFSLLSNANLPENHELDGANFLPALSGKRIKRTKPLVWAYYNALNEHQVAMREGKWKVLAKLDLDKKYQNLNDQNIETINAAKLHDFEVYKITEDIGESRNLLERKKDKKARLRKLLEERYLELLQDSFIWTVNH